MGKASGAKRRAKGGGAPGPAAKRSAAPSDKAERRARLLDKAAASKKAALAQVRGVAKKKARRSGKTGTTLQDFEAMLDALDGAGAAATSAGGTDGPTGGAGAGAAKAKAEAAARLGTSVGTARRRKLVTRTEAARAMQVVDHPAFQRDPLGTIAAHIEATVPRAPAREAPRGADEQAKAKRRKRKKRAKATATLQLEALAL
ncbi:unnamed protein product [Pedinophyceae sp. YPF-701]|nr:unnamed protein product [Pedinophyceae sp. YPF-701]